MAQDGGRFRPGDNLTVRLEPANLSALTVASFTVRAFNNFTSIPTGVCHDPLSI